MAPGLAGLTAVVTGAASGIGAAAADLLLRDGATVVALDRDAAGVAAPARGIACDVSDTGQVDRAVAEAAGPAGIDILVNCAGIGAQGAVDEADDDLWRRVLDVNVLGIARVVRAALPWLRASSAASVVNVGSIAATAGLPRRAVYSASKGAVQALTLAMAADHVADGVRVNCVNPATVDTPWVQRLLAAARDPDAELAALQARQPTGRLVTAGEVAAAIRYLAGPESASTTGTVLAVDGGMAGLRLPPARDPS